MAAVNMTIDGRQLKNFADVQRTYLWELSIPNIKNVVNTPITDDILTLHCRTVSIPGRTNEEIVSYFMGSQQNFPGRAKFSYSLDVQLEETEDQIIHTSILGWMNNQFNVNPLGSNNPGSSIFATKRAGTVDMYLQGYKYNGEPLTQQIHFVNAYPSAIGDVGLDYAGNEQVKYNVTFKYDYWVFQKS